MMSLRYGILGLLMKENMTGYSLTSYFHTYLNQMWHANQSQIYRELNWLESEGFVTSQIEIQIGKPNKKIYSITESGQHALKNWVLQFDYTDSMIERDSFSLRLFFAGAYSESETKLKDKIYAYKLENEARLRDLALQEREIETALSAETKTERERQELKFYRLSLNRGKAVFEANVAWADETLAMLVDA
ncbi:MAG: PadR family transcriptional regulator [Bacilli bacterium]